MRLPNGYGGIRKLSGKRRKPYQAVVTVGWDTDGLKARQKQKVIGSYATRAEALMALGEWNKDPVVLQKATLAEVWEKFTPTQEGYSRSKINTLKNALIHAEKFSNKPVNEVTSIELQEVVDKLTSRTYQSHHITAYRAFYEFAISHGYCTENAALNLRASLKAPPPQVNPFSLAEVQAMPERYMLFFYTGMRVGEMMNVTVDDIDFENEIILVRGGKTEAALRHIPIHPNIKDLVLATTDRLWKWDKHYGTIQKDFKEYAPNHKIHDMRKTFATVCYLSGIDDVITKRLMGHHVADITHSTYIKNDDIVLLREGLNKLNYSLLS